MNHVWQFATAGSLKFGRGCRFQLADELQRTARGVVEPSDDDVLNSAKNYFASQQLMKEEGCDGIITQATFILHKMPPAVRTVCLEFFGEVREAVRDRFGVMLRPEPVALGADGALLD